MNLYLHMLNFSIARLWPTARYVISTENVWEVGWFCFSHPGQIKVYQLLKNVCACVCVHAMTKVDSSSCPTPTELHSDLVRRKGN